VGARLEVNARHLLDANAQRLRATRALLAAYDPARRLAQGWSLTTDDEGRVLRSTASLAVGQVVRVRLADGSFRAEVLDERGVQ
jgi:exodeoxyribonuclease VII large subunit